MALSIRQSDILELARSEGKVLVDDLAIRFGVTLQTIRRDLTDLADAGRLERVHGGAVLRAGVANIGYAERRSLNAEAKAAIGRACAAAIPDNSSLFRNIGTTTEAVARELLGHRNLTVVTNNLNVANILAESESCDVIVAGGVLLAIGLGGCTAMDVISILRKKRQEVTGFEVKVDAGRTDEHPKVFTNFAIHYIVRGQKIDPASVERAMDLSKTKYCPAQAMLSQVAPMTMSYEIIEE